jgi:uncharacterized coiled-coil protein SlyX/bacterioferritin-associated ferredoxin
LSHLLEDEEGLRANTGLSLQDARLLFEKYCGANTPIPEMIDLIEFFYYLKVYPTRRQLRMIYPSLRSSTQALKRIKARLRYLADRMDDVQTAFEERREPEFQLPHYFGPNVSSCIDTFPICDFQVKRLRDSTCDILRQVQAVCPQGTRCLLCVCVLARVMQISERSCGSFGVGSNSVSA